MALREDYRFVFDFLSSCFFFLRKLLDLAVTRLLEMADCDGPMRCSGIAPETRDTAAGIGTGFFKGTVSRKS
jgi:hypothetical protein